MASDNKIFDDVFRTMLENMPQLVIPVINEAFHTSYSENEKIEQYRNEHHRKSGEIITDSYLGICDKLYHVECESSPTGNMSIRMIEYDFAIALEAAQKENNIYEVNFPHSCVLYLRHNESTPDELMVNVNLPDGQHFCYHTPTVKLQEYSKEEIFQKRLLLFLPFYIMRYEAELPEIAKNQERVSRLLAEYVEIREQLRMELPKDEETAVFTRLVELTERISNYILKSQEALKERMGEVMGGKVLELETDKILECGIKQGLEQGLEQGLSQGLEQGLSQGIEQGLSQGIEQGLSQGIERATLRFVENMLAENESLDKICEYAECSIEKVFEVKAKKEAEEQRQGQELKTFHRPGKSR